MKCSGISNYKIPLKNLSQQGAKLQQSKKIKVGWIFAQNDPIEGNAKTFLSTSGLRLHISIK